MKLRTKARCLALQILFERDATGHPLDVIIQDRWQQEFQSEEFLEFLEKETNKGKSGEGEIIESIKDFTGAIVSGVVPISIRMDEIIARHAPEWPIDQVAIIDRNILRIALWEFAIEECTPVKVAINEAVELAKLFGSESSPRFVNGVLGSLADHSREIHQVFHP
jgi:transcription antitermination protein NusB